MKNFIKKIFRISDTLYNFMVLRYRQVQYGRNLKILGKIYGVSNRRDGIIIGDNVSINSSLESNPIGGDRRTILFAKGCGKIRIGNNCGISNSTLFAAASIEIGNDVLIGGGTKIYDTDFHWLDFHRRMKEPGGNSKPVIIRDGAFIGAHCIICKGVTIGERSIVGVGSVVTKNIPSNEIWGGCPAKRIRTVSGDDIGED